MASPFQGAMDAQAVCARLATMESNRSEHVEVWRKCYQYTYPLRQHGFFGEIVTAENGLAELSRLNDSTTTEAAREWASQMVAGMTPANALWFGLYVTGSSDDERAFLSRSARIIWEYIHNSNFDSLAFEAMIDAACAGWFVMYIEESSEGGYHFELWPIAECFIASSKSGQPVDTIYRKFKLRADQAFNKYGDAVSEKIKEAIKNNKPHEQFEFIHAIYPREGGDPRARFAKNWPFASVHVELKSKKILREGGYHEFPCAVPRYMPVPGTAYPVGPVYDALPDAATVNKIKEMEFANLDIAVGGQWIAEDDGVINPRSLKLGARRVIVAASVDSLKRLDSGTNFNVAFTSEERIQAAIRKLLLADVLPPQDGAPRTATEINERMSWLRQMLGPVFGRLSSEYLQVMIERCFGIALRAGALGRPPSSLGGRSWFVKYESPLARAQKLSEVAAIDQYAAGLIQVSTSTGDQSVLDNIDFDKAARFRGEALGVPGDIIPEQKAIQQRRVQRQQMQAEAQQAQIEQEAALAGATEAAKREAAQ